MSGDFSSHTITPPDYLEGDAPVLNTVYFADALAFDYTGRTIVFDALNCLSTPESACNEALTGGYQYWSIGFLDVASGPFSYPFPNQNPAFDIGNPAFAYNNDHVVAVDIHDYSPVDARDLTI